MAKPRYRHAHQQARKRWNTVVQAGHAYCTEPICLMPTRWIPPGTPWHLCHDPSGTITIGPGHAKCNLSEGATRGLRMRKERPRPQRRWQL